MDLFDRELTWNLKLMKKAPKQTLQLSSLVQTHQLYHAHLTVSSLSSEIPERSFFLFFIPEYLFSYVKPDFLTGSNAYHLRVYVYQARNLIALDKDSFSGLIAVLILLICL